jgi:hypothetical protein
LADTDITAVKTSSLGVDTPLVLTTDFTLTGSGSPSGGELTLVAPLVSGERLTIARIVTVTQEVDYLANDKFPANTHEEALDRLTMVAQQLEENINRAVILPLSTTTSSLTLPGIEPTTIWRWNAAGTEIEFVTAAEAFAGSPPLGVDLGGTGADNASDARTNLGLTIGSSIQAYTDTLQSIGALGTTADRLLYTTALNTFAESTLTSFARTILDDVDASAVQTTLGIVVGTDVQAHDANLDSISALGTAADKMIYTTAADTWAETDVQTYGLSLLDTVDADAAHTVLGLGTLATQSGTFSGTSSGTNTGDQNLFSTIAVSGQSDVVADAASDTLTLVAGSNVTITTDAATDSITISATGGGGGGGIAGPVSSTNNAIAVWDGTGGDTLKDSNLTIGSSAISGIADLNDSNGNEVVEFTATSSAVNNVMVTNAATLGAPTISAVGSDTNIRLDIKSKGAGRVDILGSSLGITDSGGSGGSITMFENPSNGTSYVNLKAPASITTSATYILPDTNTDGFLKNTSGTWTWEAGGTSAANVVAWAKYSLSGGTPSLTSSYNVASLTDNATGDTIVVYSSALANANYAVTAAGLLTGGTGNANFQIAGPSTSQVRILSKSGTTLTDIDTVYAIMVM